MNPVRLKIKTWHKIFQWMFVVALTYSIFSVIPSTVMIGIYTGIYLVTISGSLLLYTYILIRKGKSEEKRP